ncbi:MAG: PD40 domain-containing protein [Gemmatimonadetes bacterium]|nr:PD40 domain-containing protein [Gemmatimonadota bacterium]
MASLDDPAGLLLLPDPSSAVFAPGVNGAGAGHLIFVRDGRLMAQPFDPSALELLGDAFVLAERALWGDNGAAAVSVSDNGIFTYLGGRNRETDSRLVWFDRSGTALTTEGSTGPLSPVSLSPDERTAAVVRLPRGIPNGDVWLRDLDRGLEEPFTFDGAVWGNVVWSPDSSRIAFSSAASESVGLYIADVTASGIGEPVFANGNLKVLTDWSRDGYLLYTEDHPETGADLWYLHMDGSATGDAEPVPFRTDTFDTSFGDISPDGQWIAYVSNETGSYEVWVEAFLSGAGKWLISGADSGRDAQQPRWSRDGSELFYFGLGTMMAARVRTPPGPGSSPVVDPQPLFEVRVNGARPSLGWYFYDVSGDGERFLINVVDSATEPVINVVVNWEEELRQRVPN